VIKGQISDLCEQAEEGEEEEEEEIK
jgi:hypothetical protein